MASVATTETTTPELPERPTFQEAFAAARAQHSQETTEEVADGEHAATGEESTETEEAEGTSPTRKGKAAPASAETATTTDDKTTTKSDPSGLLSDEEFSALQTKHADDPQALRKALEGAFTKKTQALAEDKKSYERLKSYSEVIDAYEADPEATVRALAKELGLSFTGDATTETTTTEETATAVDQVMTEFKESLGPELEYLADGLAPAITKLVERLTKTTVDQATKPLREQTDTLLGKAAAEQTETVMKAFGEKHPDWKEHETAMFELSQKLSPKGMTETEYLDHLYKIVTAETPDARKAAIDKQVAEGVKAALKKITKGAEATETRTRETPESQVRSGPPEGRAPSFREAHEAAKRGERWD